MTTHTQKIEKLIAELCPNGVIHEEVGKVAKYSKARIAAIELNQENYVGVDNLLPNKRGKTTSNYVPTIGRLTQFERGDILLGNIRPYLKKVWLATHGGGTSGDVLVIHINEEAKSRLQPKFLYYLFSSENFFAFDIKFSKGAKMPRGDKRTILKFKIPLPPLAVQEEIVKILDNFTELETELETEREARKKQYEHYRSELLRFNERVRWATLKEFARIKNGKDWKKLNEGDIPVYGTGGVMGHVDTFTYDKPTVLIPRKGSITNIFYLDKPFWNIDTIYYTEIDTAQVVPKFFYYFMKTVDLEKLDMGSGRPSLTQAILDKIKIPLPPLAEQEHIVTILDKFDALVNDISVGLPAELSARRSQYEYYRGKLLTFNEYAK